MTLTAIIIFGIGAALYGLIVPAKWRGYVLLISSIIAIYWLQPALPIQPVDFALPTATLVLAVIGWLLTRQDSGISGDNALTLGIMAISVIALAIFGGLLHLTPSQPPAVLDVLIVLVGVAITIIALGSVIQDRQRATPWFILLILIIFVILKNDILSQAASMWLRSQESRPLYLAQVSDLQWLGFSYVSFRLIHTLRDRQTGKLPALTLREYLTYLIFFPAYTAGPIDRAERFIKDYRALPNLDAARTIEGVSRIAIGLFKKFVIADSLALFALNTTKANEALAAGGLWVLLYAYTFRIYFDFSGYSDIAIGLGRLFGVNLPENFDRPYLKDNITAFWQSWHITLSTWVRFYVFTPLSRVLLSRPRKPSPTVVVLVTQLATMVAIGLWHGITLNFVIWGVWHGLGLFVHKLFTDRTRTFYQNLSQRPRLRRAASWGGILLTFHFVALGWVWFALPDTATSVSVLRRLFGG
jgi:D-alanyl-lipoteichoic acid acyltransferase DltB (MBOAT superfamily)